MPSDPRQSSSAKRLLKDWIEIQNNPLDTVYAEPFNCADLYHWYATLLAPKTSKYYGIVIGLEITFPQDYPHSPPTVKCLSKIHHSHVYGDWICLDMLKTHHSSEPYSGWSSSYSCLSILLQLQAFLLEEEEYQRSHIENDIQASRAIRVIATGHWPQEGKIYPMAPHWDIEEVFNSGLKKKRKFQNDQPLFEEPVHKKLLIDKQDETLQLVGIRDANSSSLVSTSAPTTLLDHIPKENLVKIFSFLSFYNLKIVERVCKSFQNVCECKYLTIARELICFHSKSTFKEDTLGIGFSVQFKGYGGAVTGISTPLDLISRESFFRNHVRKSVWGEEFDNWIPIYINTNHANFEQFKTAMRSIADQYPQLFSQKGRIDLDKADAYVELLCKLMNNMVVQIMKGVTHASIKALHGYMYFHRWLIFLMEKFPNALSNIESQLHDFINDEKCRNKTSCPNIGELLPKLTILGPSGLTWDSVKSAVIDETGARNALWVIKAHPELADISKDKNNYERCHKSWEENKVSCKLIMFHVFFLRNVVESYGDMSLSELGRLYDVNFGCPPSTKSGDSLEDVLQREVFKIQQIGSFEEFFEYVGVNNEFSSSTSIALYLRNCVKKSEQKGYHKPKSSSNNSKNNRNDRNYNSNNNYYGNNNNRNNNGYNGNRDNRDNRGGGGNNYRGRNRY